MPPLKFWFGVYGTSCFLNTTVKVLFQLHTSPHPEIHPICPSVHLEHHSATSIHRSLIWNDFSSFETFKLKSKEFERRLYTGMYSIYLKCYILGVLNIIDMLYSGMYSIYQICYILSVLNMQYYIFWDVLNILNILYSSVLNMQYSILWGGCTKYIKYAIFWVYWICNMQYSGMHSICMVARVIGGMANCCTLWGVLGDLSKKPPSRYFCSVFSWSGRH